MKAQEADRTASSAADALNTAFRRHLLLRNERLPRKKLYLQQRQQQHFSAFKPKWQTSIPRAFTSQSEFNLTQQLQQQQSKGPLVSTHQASVCGMKVKRLNDLEQQQQRCKRKKQQQSMLQGKEQRLCRWACGTSAAKSSSNTTCKMPRRNCEDVPVEKSYYEVLQGTISQRQDDISSSSAAVAAAGLARPRTPTALNGDSAKRNHFGRGPEAGKEMKAAEGLRAGIEDTLHAHVFCVRSENGIARAGEPLVKVEKPPGSIEVESAAARDVSAAAADSTFDPYLLAEAAYMRSESRWLNKQRVLVLASRGITHIQRHLMEDFKKLLPHHKAESKWERKQTLRDIAELAQLRACNNVLFFESRKRDLLLHIAKVPQGPTAIFRIMNIHTLKEMALTGNCLLHSRPLLLFDPIFSKSTLQPHWALLKELFVQVFGTPRNHPKAKPFFDHAMCFYKFDGIKLWFRHYQITPRMPGDFADSNHPERQTFVEIGPRCVFEPIKILDEAFGGKTVWSNPKYICTRDVLALQSVDKAAAYADRVRAKLKREESIRRMDHVPNALSLENIFENVSALE